MEAVLDVLRRWVVEDRREAIQNGAPNPRAPGVQAIRSDARIKHAIKTAGGNAGSESIGALVMNMDSRGRVVVQNASGSNGGAKRNCVVPAEWVGDAGVPNIPGEVLTPKTQPNGFNFEDSGAQSENWTDESETPIPSW